MVINEYEGSGNKNMVMGDGGHYIRLREANINAMRCEYYCDEVWI